ncbi:MAG: murein biosynthesis integral membrane protein MurJ [Alphaproteobacteria bacterium]|nr:murein biosynthesis integral membrane protein MurJ [Alphaproteobacteria bacterium]MCL2505864.1 murein biosynthesis integral membrane protein MurJ [Alphaproteobacteria bacterium]
MSFARSLFTVSGFTVISRATGFIRDALIAVFLGAGAMADAFFVAQRLPNLFRSLFAEGAFSAAFVPIYTKEREKSGTAAAQLFAGQALMLLLTMLVPFSVAIMLFMPQVMLVLAPGFMNDPEKYDLAVRLSTITFPYLILISVTALQTGILNSAGKFAAGAAAPIAYNLVLIIALICTDVFSLNVGYSLAWAVIAAGVVQSLFLVISCYSASLVIPIVKPEFTAAAKMLFVKIGPGVVGSSAAQINLFISTVLASLLPTGAVSYLFYADRLNQLPLGVIGVAVSTTLLPLLAKHYSLKQHDKILHYNSKAIQFCFIFGLPAAAGLLLLSEPIIQALFQYGKFSSFDTVNTSSALIAYSFGIPAFLLVKVFASCFFAMHDTKTPVKIAVLGMIVNVVCVLVLMGPLQHVGIALAISIAVNVNAVMLFSIMLQRKMPVASKETVHVILKVILSVFFMAAAIIVFKHFVLADDYSLGAGLFEESSSKLSVILPRLFGLVSVMGIGGLVYAASLRLFGVVKLSSIRSVFRG